MKSNINANLQKLFDPENYLYFNKDSYLSRLKQDEEVTFLTQNLSLNAQCKVLDLACGHGRHSNSVANLVSSVTGIDANKHFVDLAKAQALRKKHRNTTYIHADIYKTSVSETFERILLLNTVLGLQSDENTLCLLHRIRSWLSEDGLFCFDVVNRDTILVDFQPDSVIEKKQGYMIDRLSFDATTGRMTNNRVYMRGGSVSNAQFSLRLFNFTDVTALLKASGFQIFKAFANWKGEDFHAHAKKIVVVAMPAPKKIKNLMVKTLR